MAVVRLSCEKLPGVSILGTGIPREYIAHAQQFVGLLKGNTDKRASSRAFHAFLDSEAGRKIREHDGGDLLTAIHEGSMEGLMYTYRLNPVAGSPSVFVTLDGMQEIMNGLPSVDETVKIKLKEIFANYLTPRETGRYVPLLFTNATLEQRAIDDTDEGVEEIVTDTSTTMVVTHKMWYDVRVSSYESAADKRVLEAQLQAKDHLIAANESVKMAEIAKERAEKEQAQKETLVAKLSAEKEMLNAKESAAKDIQIAKLQMQLELAEEKAKLRAEFETTDRLERGEKRDKVQRVGPVRMNTRDIVFSSLISSSWRNDQNGVNSFVKLNCNNNDWLSWEPITAMPKLEVRYSAGVGNNILLAPDFKHRVFGFCFRGPAISENTLQKSNIIKEAYGVEVDGVHYVCLICFKRFSLKLYAASILPYAIGLLQCTIAADLIPGRDYHLAAYRVDICSDDPVLEMLKRPYGDKWYWHSTANKGM